jgi:thimet oligopeptidase
MKRHALVLTASSLLAAGMLACSSAKTAPRRHLSSSDDLVRSDFAPGELNQLCQQALDQAQTRLDAIAHLAPAARTFDNTVLAFETTTADMVDGTQPLSFMKYVSPVKTTHAEGANCENITGNFAVKTFGRRDLYNALKDSHPRNADETRLLQKTLEAFEANGLKLPDDKLAEVTKLLSKLNDLTTNFSDNLNNDTSTVEFTADELKGVTQDFLARLKKNADGTKYVVTTKDPDFQHVIQNAVSSDTRKKMSIAYNNRQGVANTRVLEEAIQVREQIAVKMGFRTWADFQLSHGRMAKNSQEVLDFLHGLQDKLAKRNLQDIQQLLTFKKTLDPSATQVNSWDIGYLAYQLQKKEYSLDDEKIREYFPSDYVVQAMFKVYSQLLGVNFEEVAGAHTWSPEVKLYRILDKKDGRLIGYFYTDFIPRAGKYDHFASFGLVNGRHLPDGYNKPVSAIVGNFNPPGNGKPSLLNHDEVVTVFHEFGHVMHQTLTRAPYASLSGANVAQDFVEAPSQMLENWPWEEKILTVMSGHYLDPGKKLPDDLLKKMIAVRDYQQGYFFTRQLMLGLTDMTFHTATGPVDTAATYNKLYHDLIGVDPVEGGHFCAAFGHLMGGYDAGYYGYLWSLVYATDMYSAFQKTDPLSPKTGDRYRRVILERGNMEDADVLLTRFLGRPSNNKAFLKKLHIAAGKK